MIERLGARWPDNRPPQALEQRRKCRPWRGAAAGGPHLRPV